MAARATVDEKGEALADRVVRVAPAVYWVPSQSDSGGFHVVTDLTRLGIGQGLRCDCLAGQHDRACSHRTAVVLSRQRERQRGEGR
jgi:hypothetical protein